MLPKKKLVSEIVDSYHKMYGEILDRGDLTEQRRIEIQSEYDRKVNEPCLYYEKALIYAGASCANPN